MYAGHFAAGLALKATEPKAPTWGIMLGVGLSDLLFGPLVLLGVERVSLGTGVSPGFSLDHIDWSHSLATSLLWSILFGLAFWKRGRRVALVMGAAVLSHFLLDLPVHPPDLALWPEASAHLGFGLWRALPTGWWFVELLLIAVASVYYLSAARRSDLFGRHALVVVGFVAVLHLFNAPWLAPY